MVTRDDVRASKRAGFTLMEMMVVVAILVILVGASVPIYFRYLDDANKGAAKMGIKALDTAVESYRLKYGEPPASLAVLTQPTPDGGTAYLDVSALIDPWKREYQYAPIGQHNAHLGKADIWTQGPNPADPNGIIGNWTAGVGGAAL